MFLAARRRLRTISAALLSIDGRSSNLIPLEASIAKCFTNEAAKKVSDLAVQLLGGYGYTDEYDVERFHRDAHGWAIAGGTTNMQRIRIVSEYLGRRFDQRPSHPRAADDRGRAQ